MTAKDGGDRIKGVKGSQETDHHRKIDKGLCIEMLCG